MVKTKTQNIYIILLEYAELSEQISLGACEIVWKKVYN